MADLLEQIDMDDGNPVKLCECGCGQAAPLAKNSRPKLGYVKGQALRFLPGHYMRATVAQRRAEFDAAELARRAAPGPCLLEECDKDRDASGLCDQHHGNWLDCGTLEPGDPRPARGRLRITTDFARDIKLCIRCEIWLPLSNFGTNRARGGGGWNAYCNICQASYQRERRVLLTPEQRARYDERDKRWREANQDKLAEFERQRRFKRFGITETDYLAMLDEQDNKCAICGDESSDPCGLVIDHDHDTGEVRGLLCSKCNTGLGSLKDDPWVMIRAALYVARARGGDALCASLVAAFDLNPPIVTETVQTLF